MEIAERIVDLRVDLGERDLRMACMNFGKPQIDQVRDRGVACTLGAAHREGDNRLAIKPRERAWLGSAVGDLGEIIKPNLAAARQRDRQCPQSLNRAGSREGADGLFL